MLFLDRSRSREPKAAHCPASLLSRLAAGLLLAALAPLPCGFFAAGQGAQAAGPGTDTTKPGPKVDTSQSAAPSYEMGAEVVKVLQRMKIEETKPRFYPPVDPYEPINAALRSDKYVYDDKVYDLMDSSGAPHLTLPANYARRPLVSRFNALPVEVNSPQFEDKVTDWDLVVSNSKGENVRRISGTGNPPDIVEWDGADDRGNMLVTGETYTYTFYGTDPSGRQLRVPGRPQRITGLYYQDRAAGEWVTTVASDQVFQPGSSLLADGGSEWLEAVCNVIKERFRNEVSIYVYAEKQNLAADRADAIKSYLGANVFLPKEALTVAPKYVPGLDLSLARIEVHVD